MAKNALLKAEGWIITQIFGIPKGFPLQQGITLLFGQKPKKVGQYSVAWIDPAGCLQVLDATVAETVKGATLKATIAHASRKWQLSGDCKCEGTKHRISGSLKLLDGGKPRSSQEGPFEGAGTWSAEGNPGGGGGGTGGITALAGPRKQPKRGAPTSKATSKEKLAS